ncbi:MAG: hypothetical protein ACD_28C00333G0002 [uncultured bacterium]|nr:MAG: hypothetical protein ACD_28C00333G0002 [uncultured bacterium]
MSRQFPSLKSRFATVLSLVLVGVLFVGSLFGALPVHANSDASLSDLQDNIDTLFPSASYISGLEYHSTWSELSRKTMSEANGIEITYEAIFDDLPQWEDELPTMNVYLIAESSTEAAKAQFDAWADSHEFTSGLWDKVSAGKDYFTYYAPAGENTDLVKYRPLEEGNLHFVSYYGNVLIVVNFYRTAGEYLKNNVDAYLQYLDQEEETLAILNEVVIYAEEALKFYLGTSFSVEGPTDYDYYLTHSGYSLDITKTVEVPRNGTLSLEVYIDDSSETGSLLNMYGLEDPAVGMFAVNLNENAGVEWNFYDPSTSSACRDSSGWHHLVTDNSLNLYEWETLTLNYGADGGLKLYLNGQIQDSCPVSTPRVDTPVYLGDYPDDTIQESFVGYVKNITTSFSVDEDQNVMDEVQSGDLIFADVSTSDPYADAIEYMKDEGIIQGYSDGTFRPNQSVNRVEILKMLLLGFGYKVSSNYSVTAFNDLKEGEWYLPYLNYAVKLGIVGGYPDGTYHPGDSLNRVEFLKILLIAYGLNLSDYPIATLYPDTSKTAWYAAYVQYSKDEGLLDPDSKGNFNPDKALTRGEVAETIYRLLEG